MSLGAKSSGRAKHKLRASLDAFARQQIDEFHGPVEVCCECGCDLLVVEIGMCARCEDQMYAAEADLDDRGIDDYYQDDYYQDDDWRYDPDYSIHDDWDQYDDLESPGSYYKHRDGRVLLCCRIDGRTLYVDTLTGLEVRINPYELELVA